METHKIASGSLVGHAGRDCHCNPKVVVHFTGKNSGRFTPVTVIHN